MELTIYVPTPWRQITAGQARVAVEGDTVRRAVENLATAFPGLQAEICQADGRIREHINVFVNGREIRSLGGEGTHLRDGDEIAFIPAMAGG